MKNFTPFAIYEAYKNTHIDGIENIPLHWYVKRFRYVFKFGKGLTITKENLKNEGVPCVNYGEIHSKYGFEIIPEYHQLKCVSEDYLTKSSNSLLNRGDFIFADTSEDLEGSGNFTYLNSNEKTFAGYHTVIARPQKDINYRYTAYYFDSLAQRSQIKKKVKGVKVYSITQNILKDTWLVFPDKKEQTAIANFLDKKTKQIDEAIAIKEKQIELLKERKQILIQNAVTRGLDPNVPMKDSGVEWIGEIPEHWKIKRFRYLFKFGKGLTITKDDLQDDGIPCLNYGEIHSKYGFEVNPKKNTLKCVSEKFMVKSNKSLLNDGDFIFADTSEDVEGSGNFTYLNGKETVFAGYHTVIAKPSLDINSRYFAYFFDSLAFRTQIRKRVKGVKVYSITQSILKNPILILPPDCEQIALSLFLDEKVSKLHSVIKNNETQIEKLKEYKATLINSAVTGKIKVT